MKKHLKQYIFKTLLIFSLCILTGTSYIYIQNIVYSNILREKPTDIEVVNINTVSAQIFWKTPLEGNYKFYFKKDGNNDEYIQGGGIEISRDWIQENRVFTIKLDDLEPNTQYSFNIQSKNHVWNDNFRFKTKDISDELSFPSIVTGEDEDKANLLVDIEGNKYMVNTQYHGTFAFNSQDKEYTVTKYSRYITTEELKSRLLEKISTPLYAATGANCMTNIKLSSSTFPSKAKAVDIINRWVAKCPSGGYPETCFEDLYCNSVESGVNLGFALTIWSHESGGSNYAYTPNVEDFGIHGLSTVPAANFTKQMKYFLNNIAKPGYISSCTWDKEFDTEYPNKTLSKEIIMWGAKYSSGKCSDLASLSKGYEYMQDINTVYGWYTNQKLTWPFTALGGSSGCDYKSAVKNTAYNSCNSKGTSQESTPEDPSDPSTPIPEGGDGVKDWMAITGINNEGQVISPEVNRTCADIDGCICIWNYNKSGQSTKIVTVAQTCKVDGTVTASPVDPEQEPSPEPEPTPDPGEVIDDPRCGGRATTYLSTSTCWPPDVSFCAIGTPSPTTLPFPAPGQTVTWECVNGPATVDCEAKNLTSENTGPLCGSRNTDYPPTMPDWPTNSSLCYVGTPTPTEVPFPANGATVTWQCKEGDKSVSCESTTAMNVPFDTICCLNEQEVYITKPEQCTGKKLDNISDYGCKSQNITLTFEEGVNIYKAVEVVNYDEVPIGSARDLITFSKNVITSVGIFKNDTWEKIVKFENGSINGEDFKLVSGEVYMVTANKYLEIPIKMVGLIDQPTQLAELVGWNLVPTSLLSQSTTDTATILNNSAFQSINQIGIWNNELGRYDYTVRDSDGSMYGESIPLNPNSGIFIKIPKVK